MNEHWTDDEVLLDAFLRDELTPGERARYQEHLEGCPKCGARLATERSLVAGIRTVGRQALKGELRSMLAERSSRRAMTVRWLAAAAVVAIILTVWQYPSGNDAPPSFTEVPGMDTTSDGDSRSGPESSAEADVVITETDSRIEEPQITRPTELAAPLGERLTDAAASGAGAAAPAGENREGVSELADLSDEAGETRRVTWSTAIMSSNERENKDIAQKAVQAQKFEKRMQVQEAEAVAAASPLARAALPELRLEQSAFSDAPLAAQQNVPSQDEAHFPIRVLQKDDSTIVTIFPKVQLSPLDVRNSVAVLVGDSVEVQIGTQIMRFGAQVLQQTTRR